MSLATPFWGNIDTADMLIMHGLGRPCVISHCVQRFVDFFSGPEVEEVNRELGQAANGQDPDVVDGPAAPEAEGQRSRLMKK